MKKKNIIIISVGVLLVIALVITLVILNTNNKTDAKKFSEEYNTVSSDNIFTYRTAEEIIKILKHGTGIVYLGFPECPWCMEYVKYLNDTAKESEADEIYYYNILDIRKNNTKEYQEIVSILSDYLQYDKEGNKRIYVPAVLVVDHGKIVGFDDETAWDTKGYEKPKDYWTEEEVKELKSNLNNMFSKIYTGYCTTDCN